MIAQNLFDAVGLAPALPGARCRGRHELFDPPGPDVDEDAAAYAEQVALQLCSQCPSLVRCAEWVDALPKHKRPPGVVAGKSGSRP